MPPLTTKDDDGRDWIAVGLIPTTGELVWVPSDTELQVAPIFDYEQDEPAPEDPIDAQARGIVEAAIIPAPEDPPA